MFHYFHNKKDLYLFLLDYVSGLTESIYKKVNWNERDIFNRLIDIGLVKIGMMNENPYVFYFMDKALKETSEEVKDYIKETVRILMESGMVKIYEGIDFSKFRDDIDLNKTIHIINWTMFGFGEEQKSKITSFEEVDESFLEEWKEYFNIMKKCFYKEQYR